MYQSEWLSKELAFPHWCVRTVERLCCSALWALK